MKKEKVWYRLKCKKCGHVNLIIKLYRWDSLGCVECNKNIVFMGSINFLNCNIVSSLGRIIK